MGVLYSNVLWLKIEKKIYGHQFHMFWKVKLLTSMLQSFQTEGLDVFLCIYIILQLVCVTIHSVLKSSACQIVRILHSILSFLSHPTSKALVILSGVSPGKIDPKWLFSSVSVGISLVPTRK